MQTWLKVGRNLRDLVVVLARGSGAVAALTVLAMCLMITAEVVLRGAFNEF